EQQVEQVDGEQRIPRGASLDRGCSLVMQPMLRQMTKGSRIGRVLVGAQRDRLRVRQRNAEQVRDAVLDGPRIGTAVEALQLGATAALAVGHGAFAAKGSEGKAID